MAAVLVMLMLAGCYSNNCPLENTVTCNYGFYDAAGTPITYVDTITVTTLKPGYKTVRIDPQHPQGLQWVRVTRRTPYGTIVVSWKQENGSYKLHLEIPNGITATVGNRVLGAGKYDL